MARYVAFSLVSVLLAGSAAAQDPISADVKFVYTSVKNNVIKSAEKMPEDKYAFKPSPDVRSYGQLLGHIADASYAFCAAAAGEKRDPAGIEKSKTTKAELSAALGEAFGYCDKVYDGMTDAKGAEMVKFFGRERTKLGVLAFNNAHDMEHYGNLVTYLRINGIVPPSSERR